MIADLSRRIIAAAFARSGPALREHIAVLVERSFEPIVYHRLAARGYRPATIIDVGAFRGDWSQMARRIFGPVPTLMIEAQSSLIPALKAAAEREAAMSVIHATLGARDGQPVDFFEMGTGSSMFSETSNAPRTASKQVTKTLDDVVARALGGTAANAFLKLDVQGAELQVLQGGCETLAGCSLVQLELAMLQYNAGAPLLPEVVAWMADQGWWPTEVSGFSRPRDRLVQIDMLFAPADSELRPTSFVF